MDACLADYACLIAALRASCPDAVLCIQSVLPVGREIELPLGCTNATVRRFNEGLRAMALEQNLPYIDLYAVYEENGALNPALTRDGVHLNFNAYGPWAEEIRPLLCGD